MSDHTSNEERKPPALVIKIQSWATPFVGVVMLVLGLGAGYLIRPMLATREGGTTAPTSLAATQTTVTEAEAPTLLPTTDSSQDLMTFLTTQVKHFKGDPNAPVTIIEFSDFQ